MRLFLLFLLLLPVASHGTTLHANARAATEEQAKREALAALADSILVNVKSEFTSHMEGSGKHHEEHDISALSDLPLIGVEMDTTKLGNDVACEARLDSGKSLPLYAAKLKELAAQIAALDQRIAKSSGDDRYALLSQALTQIEQYEKYRAVAQLLGDNESAAPPRSRADTEAQLRALEKAAPSLGLAADVLAKGLKADVLYVYPPMPYGSHEVTPFGRVMRDRLAAKFNAVDSPDKAQMFLKGDYEVLNDSMHLTYRLVDRDGNTAAIRMATLAPSAYKGLQVKPASLDFDRLLHEGVAVSDDFRAQLNTNRGSEDILFDEHEEVELLVKLSRPGYFYVVGHVAKNSENYSYLLELSGVDSDRRFVRYVNADDVNKWLSIGRFEVSAPFGVESLQLIASSDDPIGRLPRHTLDKKSEMYVTAGDAREGVLKTRALKPKRSETDKQYQAEAVLMFTTMAKGGAQKE